MLGFLFFLVDSLYYNLFIYLFFQILVQKFFLDYFFYCLKIEQIILFIYLFKSVLNFFKGK